MYRPDRTLYRTPFSAAYWRTALQDFKQVRTLTFAALMIVACIALSYIPSIPVSTLIGSAKVTWGWLARSICGMVGGPITALVFGAAEDTISFIVKPPAAPYFPGYTLTTMLGTLIYALFLYRAKPSVVRIFFAKLFTNLLNVTLGALWSTMLYGKQTYIAYMTVSFWKNLVSLPVQTIMLCILVGALAPVMSRMGLIAPQGDDAKLRFI